jgi:hypothetical protein
MTTSMLVFVAAAAAVNLVMYGGIASAYFADKHRVDPPKPGTAPAPAAAGQPDHRELARAA